MKQKHANELMQAELQLLVSQIRPHFLFNVLGAISELCLLDGQRAQSAIVSLASYFRGSLSLNKPYHSVGEELELLAKYLDLQRLRFGSRLAVNINIAEHARELLLPAFTLLSLLENAIKHGLELSNGTEAIDIFSKDIENGWIEITVRNAVGGEQLADMENAEKNRGLKIGNRNIDKRLKLLHPNSGLCTSAEDGYFHASFKIPVKVTALVLEAD